MTSLKNKLPAVAMTDNKKPVCKYTLELLFMCIKATFSFGLGQQRYRQRIQHILKRLNNVLNDLKHSIKNYSQSISTTPCVSGAKKP